MLAQLILAILVCLNFAIAGRLDGCIKEPGYHKLTLIARDSRVYSIFVDDTALAHTFDIRKGNTKCFWVTGKTFSCGPCGDVWFQELELEAATDQVKCWAQIKVEGRDTLLEAYITSGRWFTVTPMQLLGLYCYKDDRDQVVAPGPRTTLREVAPPTNTKAASAGLAGLSLMGPAAVASSQDDIPNGCEKCASQQMITFGSGRYTFNACLVNEQINQELVLGGDTGYETVNLMCTQKDQGNELGCEACWQLIDTFQSESYECTITLEPEASSKEEKDHILIVSASKTPVKLPYKGYPKSVKCVKP